MSFKEWFNSKPYWLKGGLVGSLIGIMAIIITFMAENFIFITFHVFIATVAICGENNVDCAWTVITIGNIASLFLVGVLIGWIYGKFKK